MLCSPVSHDGVFAAFANLGSLVTDNGPCAEAGTLDWLEAEAALGHRYLLFADRHNTHFLRIGNNYVCIADMQLLRIITDRVNHWV